MRRRVIARHISDAMRMHERRQIPAIRHMMLATLHEMAGKMLYTDETKNTWYVCGFHMEQRPDGEWEWVITFTTVPLLNNDRNTTCMTSMEVGQLQRPWPASLSRAQ